MRRLIHAAGLAGLMALAASPCGYAHHSFAVFFDADRIVKVEGTVSEFQFRNPHGLIRLDVPGTEGAIEKWKVETNSPSILERRGWSRTTLKAGDRIQVEGWPARDGTHYLRMRLVTRPDGSVIGTPLDMNVSEQK